ncbi:transcription regulator [Lacticaseibacillus zeae DSM 20178 = KCTC 3804]|jgi:DeoR family glycerol-3-phosphate regulon repressor|uniref:DeoR/GlpR transcriptional regulator n=2 Tax=Lacticaseibacillus zeae TaxID=57037 RepID=A0A5R8LQS8_LACZE|nr:DeoR/GlpR family DNA-binding transcription regulator [Lacticaseibacillus zeae]OLS06852.1 D-beta-hydroxybutyrate dehydrogenase [Lacticaseibacillus casei]KRK13082.1 transcription regulator [Lacticaseibacillus zeae DSM 20178 = KCTC 3804]QVI31911.1 DeoR/GlpR transcriptional regulator [Lacticaseibacillus zeae]TLF39577.1 DeoR/GlpR transcriptional regulator [Lacticaseibacillus zeae]TLF41521.1 DeoR/GlpR transcriptional regulator [Lacticaseibacillus zeae]
MDITERQKWIVDKLNRNGNVRISKISEELGISRETIRKDIYSLNQRGLVNAVRGGAVLPTSVKETKYDKRKKMNVAEKKEIANMALHFIQDGFSIFLDYGTTNYEVAEAIKKANFKDLTVVTNSTNVLKSLEYQKGIQIIFLGGNLRQSEGAVSGPLTINNISNIYCDIGFFGVGGITLKTGITNHYIAQVDVSKKMMDHCRIKIVLADHTKFELTALYKTTDVQNVDIVITDHLINEEVAQQMRLADISFIDNAE